VIEYMGLHPHPPPSPNFPESVYKTPRGEKSAKESLTVFVSRKPEARERKPVKLRESYLIATVL
jgi:hypothetical protein